MDNNRALYGKNVTILGIIYTAFLILSNLTASKVAEIAGFHFTAVIFLFPFTYIIDDILTEVYGFKISRIIIWIALGANIIVVFGALLVNSVPPSADWGHQDSFDIVFGMSLRILAASICAYLFGEFVNAILLAKMKILTRGKYFGLRAIFSTIIGAILDTSIFMFVAFAFVLPVKVIFSMIFVEYIIKIVIEVIVLPFTYALVKYLKKVEGIDFYDYGTKFNPFSLRI